MEQSCASIRTWNRVDVSGLALILMLASAGCWSTVTENERVVIFAAASLQGAVEEAAVAFRRETGEAVSMNFASSGALAEQILSGAQADIFISANRDSAKKILQSERVASESETRLASNSLVIIANHSTEWGVDSIEDLYELPFRHLVIGDPRFVPAGQYARRYLQSVPIPRASVSLWESIEGRVSPTSDLGRVLALVESDRSLVGITYATDALASQDVRVIFHIPRERFSVDYFVLKIRSSAAKDARATVADRFVSFMNSDSGKRILKRYGFDL